MDRYAVFLRGMNLGGRRLTNDVLCGHVAALGFRSVAAFRASGNVVLESDLHDGREVAARVAEGLSAALDYDVPAFARSAAQVAAMAVAEPFPEGVPGTGRLQVAILSAVPSGESAARALAMSSERDLLRLDGADLYWQPHGSVLDTGLDMRALERELGPFTVRTKGTIEQLARRHFAP